MYIYSSLHVWMCDCSANWNLNVLIPHELQTNSHTHKLAHRTWKNTPTHYKRKTCKTIVAHKTCSIEDATAKNATQPDG